MDYFAGLDVSVKDTSVCIVDDTGKIAGSEGRERTRRFADGTEEPDLPLQAGWARSWAAVAMNVRFHGNRWGNRPAFLWIAKDLGCCASG